MAKDITLTIVADAWGDVQSRGLHYDQLKLYYHEAATIAGKMQAELAKIAEARRGMVLLESKLAAVRGQIDCSCMGMVIEKIWVETLREMHELMADLLDRRTRIKSATAELDKLSQSLAHKQHIISEWYTESTPQRNGGE